VASDFADVFAALKPILGKYASRLSVKADTAVEYTLLTKSPSPFPQHKGQPMYFGTVRLGKAYVSYHLVPIYMHRPLTESIRPALKKHMQGKACFNFKRVPEAALMNELKQLTAASFEQWRKNKWL
jgi:hypothetical protein